MLFSLFLTKNIYIFFKKEESCPCIIVVSTGSGCGYLVYLIFVENRLITKLTSFIGRGYIIYRIREEKKLSDQY